MQLVVKRRGSCESPSVTARNRREVRRNVLALIAYAFILGLGTYWAFH
jgi:hypothetical protein